MEAALLHGEVFNIESLRKKLEEQNLQREEIIKYMDANYRNFSKKHSFICLCCQTPVTMNLTKDEGRPFFFRHMDGSECAYSENTKAYDTQISTHENKRKKDVGLTVFRDILEGQLKPLGVVIERGYLYKKKLSFVPDFILTFPNSDQLWVVDYFTAMAQHPIRGFLSFYQRELKKEMGRNMKIIYIE